jgi:hypothetical protein
MSKYKKIAARGSKERARAAKKPLTVTVAMREAGAAAYREWYDSGDWREENLAERVFLAMMKAALRDFPT